MAVSQNAGCDPRRPNVSSHWNGMNAVILALNNVKANMNRQHGAEHGEAFRMNWLVGKERLHALAQTANRALGLVVTCHFVEFADGHSHQRKRNREQGQPQRQFPSRMNLRLKEKSAEAHFNRNR